MYLLYLESQTAKQRWHMIHLGGANIYSWGVPGNDGLMEKAKSTMSDPQDIQEA